MKTTVAYIIQNGNKFRATIKHGDGPILFSDLGDFETIFEAEKSIEKTIIWSLSMKKDAKNDNA